MRMKSKQAVPFLIAIVVAFFYIFPFWLVLNNAFKARLSILQNPISLPNSFDLKNFTVAFTRMNFPYALMNSIIITLVSGVILIVLPSMLAYYLLRFDYRANKIIFIVLVLSMIIPFQALMIPFVSIYGALGVLNSRLALVYFYLGFGVSLSTFMYHGFIKTLPIALEESAFIDGANRFQIFWYVVFPMVRPITATIIILNALWIWNDFLLPSLVLFLSARTLPLSTYSFFGQYTSNYGVAMAGLVLSIIPIVILYLVMQRNIISGITDGAVKG
jgi:raffinose/stachyose/melibiose transport system permease protein